MITRDQVNYWLEHRHLTGLAERLDSRRDPIDYETWATIEEMFSRASVIARGLASREFEQMHDHLLAQQFTPEAINLLRAAASVG